MKTFAVACLIAATSAVSLSNSCLGSGVQGVTCVPNSVLFATGMNGDEDLGQDITMKGQKFHYAGAAPANTTLFAVGMNGDEDLGQDITMKGQKFHYTAGGPAANTTASFANAPADVQFFAVGMNGDEDLGQEITMKGQKFRYSEINELI